MKTPNVKAIALAIIVCLISARSFAVPVLTPEDTTRKTSLTYSARENDSIFIIKEANVEFPAILSGVADQAIDYIEKFSKARKGYLMRTWDRSRKLFPQAAAILKKYDVPQEFKVLLALESGFNPNAVSSAGAVGYWQFMDVVAKEYGLRIVSNTKEKKEKKEKKERKTVKKNRKTVAVDDRKNFTKSTHAAARYLKDRGRNLNNDWLLIAASYNWGVGNVWNAMEKTGKANPTFWDISKYLPTETKTYVMNFIAMNVIFNNYEKFSKDELCFRPVVYKKQNNGELPPLDILSLL